MKLLIIFIILNIFNVILQTVKSICTVKCGKTVAAIVNAVAFGLYTVVIVFTNAASSVVSDISVFTDRIVWLSIYFRPQH